MVLQNEVSRHNEVKELLSILKFNPQDAHEEEYYKTYPNHNDYIIKVNMKVEKIDYGTKITLGDTTTSNFKASENFVVLECINRLLEKGYSPDSLFLEEKWPLGKKEKGKLDILVKEAGDKAFLMIECKTWGEEYEKEKRKTLNNGGQLFSYFPQDKGARYLCLYASRIENKNIEYVNDIIKVEPSFKTYDTVKEVFKHWNKNLKDNGIFESWASPYGIEIKALTRGRLRELKEEDSKRIYNQFAEILRHNVVSDKPNAFNKIFNLFLCKIVDEDRMPDEECLFQWYENDTDEKLQKRLNDLYKKGMKEYLTKDVTDYNDQDLNDKLYALEPKVIEQIKDMFTKVRLHKNNEFAFKEVFDDKSFKENALVVREVVELLQPYQIRYTHKQQFLGDFFELLLNTGIKQEVGQYFTPVPIARFIISCIPLSEIMQKKIDSGQTNFLPYTIDYAAGSGHFLTESMDEIQNLIEKINPDIQKPSVRSKLKSWKDNPYDWAYDYIYGVEADYRLVKTAKVSCFLNGDGLANVIHANGLDNFQSSKDYIGKLKEISPDDPKDNMNFDVLVANPPYSVSAFKNTLNNSENSFELFDLLTDSSSEIECLFIERAKQLLNNGGVGGIILPSTILNNLGIYTAAREIILKYFKLKAIVKLGSNTFMATGTGTIILFLERRGNNEWRKIEREIKSSFLNYEDTTINGLDDALSLYINKTFKNISLTDYFSIYLEKKPSQKLEEEELFQDYVKWFNDLKEVKILKKKKYFKDMSEEEQKNTLNNLFKEKVKSKEQEKMLYFYLTYPQKTVLIEVGKKKEEKSFLGYEFSSRRGQEGIKIIKDENQRPITKLYDEDDNFNQEKVNYYVYNAFLDNFDFTIHDSLKKNVRVSNLDSLLDFSKINFEKQISMNPLSEINYEEIWKSKSLVTLNDIVNIKKGTSITKAKTVEGAVPVIAGGQEPAYLHNTSNRKGNIITVSASGAYSGFVNYFDHPIFASDCNTIISKSELNFSTKVIYYLLKYIQEEVLYKMQRGQAQPHVYSSDLEKIKIPSIKPDLQKKLLNEIDILEQDEKKIKKEIKNLESEIENLLNESFSNANRRKIENVAWLDRGRFNYRPRNAPHLYRNGIYPFIQTGDVANSKGKKIIYSQNLNENGLEVSTLFKANTILITIAANIGSTAILDYDACFPDSIVSIRPKEDMNINYLEYYLRTVKEYLNQIAPEAAQKNINLETLKTLKVPAPPINEQDKLMEKVQIIEQKVKEHKTFLMNVDIQRNQVIEKYIK